MHSKLGSVEFVLLLYLGHFVQIFIHGTIALDLWALIALQVIRAVRVDLHFCLPILVGLGQVLLELDTDELPLLRLFGYFGGRYILDHLLEIGIFI